MRVENWNWKEADEMVAKASMDRVKKAAEVIAERTRQNTPVGTISRPMYKKGPHAGQAWTKRDAGELKRSVRVVERDTDKYGFALAGYGNVRIYAGHYLAWYARIVEYYSPYLRPAIAMTASEVKNILETG